MGLNTFRYQFVVPLDPPQTDPSKFEADEDERGTERTTNKKLYYIKFNLFKLFRLPFNYLEYESK